MFNQLVKAEDKQKTVYYFYDALGRRFKQLVDAGEGDKKQTTFNYYDFEPIQDGNHYSQPFRRYINGAGVDERVAFINYVVKRPDGSTSLTTNPKISYYHTDYLGTTVAMSSHSSGQRTSAFTYNEFGISGEEDSQPFRFTGRRLAAATWLYYLLPSCSWKVYADGPHRILLDGLILRRGVFFIWI